jgi:hypothetical protein
VRASVLKFSTQVISQELHQKTQKSEKKFSFVMAKKSLNVVPFKNYDYKNCRDLVLYFEDELLSENTCTCTLYIDRSYSKGTLLNVYQKCLLYAALLIIIVKLPTESDHYNILRKGSGLILPSELWSFIYKVGHDCLVFK